MKETMVSKSLNKRYFKIVLMALFLFFIFMGNRAIASEETISESNLSYTIEDSEVTSVC